MTNGPDVHPGANFVETHSGNQKKFLKYCDRQEMAKLLKPGDKVSQDSGVIKNILSLNIESLSANDFVDPELCSKNRPKIQKSSAH